MRELLEAVKADLQDRRLRPLVIVVGVALIAALAFVVLGGSSPSSTPTASTESVKGAPIAAPSLPSSGASNPQEAAAETTYGHHARDGKIVDPFTELATSTSTTTTASKGSSSGSSGSGGPSSKGSGSSASPASGSSGSSTPSGGGSSSSSPPPPPPKPKTHVEVTANVELGPAPTTAGEPVQLTTYKHVKLGTALPSKSHPLVVLKAATMSLKDTSLSATFALASSPIVNGPGKCLPSDSQCESVKLTNGQLEELQYAEENGQTVTYLLRVAAVFKKTFTTG